MPKPDKTKIDKWNFTEFAKHIVKSEDLLQFEQLPEEVKDIN